MSSPVSLLKLRPGALILHVLEHQPRELCLFQRFIVVIAVDMQKDIHFLPNQSQLNLGDCSCDKMECVHMHWDNVNLQNHEKPFC